MTEELVETEREIWFQNWFESEHYLKLYRHRDKNDALKLANLVKNQLPGHRCGSVLDLACGSGRHSIEFAKRGYKVTGFDLSNQLLRIAQLESQKLELNLKFVRGDIRSLPFKPEFDLVLNIFTSWGYFESDEENCMALKNAYNLKKEGGKFIFDFFNSDSLVNNLKPFSDNIINGIRYIENRSVENGRVVKNIKIVEGEITYRFKESVRLFTPDEIYTMLEEFGAKNISLFGDYDGSSFKTQNSPRFICIV
ncbi:class I SAM-dependent methyltransferase [Ignavibacteriales bacterium]